MVERSCPSPSHPSPFSDWSSMRSPLGLGSQWPTDHSLAASSPDRGNFLTVMATFSLFMQLLTAQDSLGAYQQPQCGVWRGWGEGCV